ncbi:MAG: protein-glutamate O-methyltransferase CheR [Deltaproteobacteria bacterium]|nr:protein-glutamate O-methyltransferase CheR [Deltaproteobacteria bacterium]
MALPITKQEFILLRDLIERQFGITLRDDKAYLVESRLSNLVKEINGKCYGDLYRRITNGPDSKYWLGAVVDAITTNETLWFRDQYPFKTLEKQILPLFKEEITQGKRSRIQIWSSACSTGQEPYSIAMCVIEFYKSIHRENDCYQEVNVLASDISQKALSKAKTGEYDATSMDRGLSPEHTQRFFTKKAKEWMVAENIKKLVTFKEVNLKTLGSNLGGPFDIIFLRNVIIYFSDPFKKTLFDHMSRLLSPKGYLFLGSGETVSGYTEAFEIIHDQGAIYYRLKKK